MAVSITRIEPFRSVTRTAFPSGVTAPLNGWTPAGRPAEPTTWLVAVSMIGTEASHTTYARLPSGVMITAFGDAQAGIGAPITCLFWRSTTMTDAVIPAM